MDWVKSLPAAEIRKLHGTMYAVKGDPDLYGCIAGRMFVIECKQPGKYPSKIQYKRLREWNEAGAVTGVARSLEDAKTILNPLLDMPDYRAQLERNRITNRSDRVSS